MKAQIFGVLFAVLGFTMSPAGATTLTVDWAGSGDYTNINAGVGAAGAGDTVLVLPGTYTGAGNRDISFGGTNLILISNGGRDVTIIDCDDAGRGFHFHNGEDTTSVVRGFTITSAVADSGAGAFCWNGSGPRFEDCLFLDNTAQITGGGLCCLGSSPIVRDCRFEQNTADKDDQSDGDGGGMAIYSCPAVLVVDTEFVSNQARYGGGGLYSYYSPATVTGCVFTGNDILNYGNEGAGARLAFTSGITFTECSFVENGTASTAIGGGMHASSTDVTVTDCTFLDNFSGTSGGMHFIWDSNGTISGCTFAGNVSDWGACGGISCVFNSNPTIRNCTFVDNDSEHIYCDASSPTIEYSILAFTVHGLPIYCNQGTETPHIHHCFVCANAGGDTLCGANFHDIDNSDPLFCDRANQVFTLCENSPCLPGVTWTSLVGAHGSDCPPCESPVEPTSWGSIKATYR